MLALLGGMICFLGASRISCFYFCYRKSFTVPAFAVSVGQNNNGGTHHPTAALTWRNARVSPQYQRRPPNPKQS